MSVAGLDERLVSRARSGKRLDYEGQEPPAELLERMLAVPTDFLRRAAGSNAGLEGADLDAALERLEHGWLRLRGELIHLEVQATAESAGAPTIVIVPGLGDHARRHTPFAGRLAEAGLNVISLDRRGHGLSEGRRGDSPLETDLELIELAAADARRRFGGPVVPVGDSLGGIMLWYLLTREPDVEAAVCHCISHPEVAHDASMRYKAPLMRALARVAPYAPIPVGQIADYEHVALDPQTKAYFDSGEDKLFNATVSARTAASYLGFSPARPWSSIETPTLVVIGEADRMVSPRFTRGCIERDRPPRAELLELPGAGHQLFLDHLAQSFEPIVGWIRVALKA